jgi:hypothetical protein
MAAGAAPRKGGTVAFMKPFGRFRIACSRRGVAEAGAGRFNSEIVPSYGVALRCTSNTKTQCGSMHWLGAASSALPPAPLIGPSHASGRGSQNRRAWGDADRQNPPEERVGTILSIACVKFSKAVVVYVRLRTWHEPVARTLFAPPSPLRLGSRLRPPRSLSLVCVPCADATVRWRRKGQAPVRRFRRSGAAICSKTAPTDMPSTHDWFVWNDAPCP